jgi:hypothetical protein
MTSELAKRFAYFRHRTRQMRGADRYRGLELAPWRMNDVTIGVEIAPASAPRVIFQGNNESNNFQASSRVIRRIPDKLRYRAPQTNETSQSTSVGWRNSSGSDYAVISLLLLIRRRHMKFVVVNGRTPRPQSFCALCCEPIGGNYLREIATRLSYCDHRCYVGRQKLAAPAPTKIVRERNHVVETQSALSTC